MPPYNLVKRRFGRLIVMSESGKRNSNGNVTWICHCDCGNTCYVSSRDLVNGKTQSCGCLRKERIRQAGEARRNIKHCVICGKAFKAPPSGRSTCSDACEAELRRKQHKGKTFNWGKKARERLASQGQTENLKKGTPAAQVSPLAGRFETNVNAKYWVIESPMGDVYEIDNLTLWARKHTELFGKLPCEHSVGQIVHGFYTAKRAILGKPKQHTPTYMGWQILKFGEKSS